MNKVLASISIALIAAILANCVDVAKSKALYQPVSAAKSNVIFNNQLQEDEDFNIIEYLYFYNGGGVALGDINKDGLVDIYFSSNQSSNKLYLNKGNWNFEDITLAAGVAGSGNWKTGVAMADVNGDGWLDIFVCGVSAYKKFNSRNQLFLNNGDLTFTESAMALGLSFSGFSTQAAFFDYDSDGDLDMYLANHSVHSPLTYGKASNRLKPDSLAGDRLYRNELSQTGNLKFTDVTNSSGIYNSAIGYALAVGVSDFNQDGYPDIYISNDFSENDYLYINNKNGTFTESAAVAFQHTSRFSMGNDIADLNNDGWPDVVTMDMRPRSESVIKTSGGEDSYEIWKFKLDYGFQTQVSRNTVQINQGAINAGHIVFSDVAQFSTIDATDWSWCPLIFDADGDGNKDVFISNGIVRRPNNMDYMAFISSDSAQNMMKNGVLPWIKLMPDGGVSNFFFKGNGNTLFSDVSASWGITGNDFSTGAAYADLDNDGDPDLVVNRINKEALLLENQNSETKFLKIDLKGPPGNSYGIGAKVRVSQGGKQQFQELYPARGWQSSSSYSLLFGVMQNEPVDIEVTWPDRRVSRVKASEPRVLIEHTSASGVIANKQIKSTETLVSQTSEIVYRHQEDEFSPFSREILIPFSMSDCGPTVAVSDDNNISSIFIGSSLKQASKLFALNSQNNWVEDLNWPYEKQVSEDTDAVFFDFDNDGDNDLLVVAGGGEKLNDKSLVPRLYQNDKGRWKLTKGLIPEISLNASCAEPYDFDKDGDMDVFIGGTVMPYLYGMPPPSYLFENVGGRFIINQIWSIKAQFDSPVKGRPGMVTDAVWSDVNRDGRPDLILVGQWMPITVLIQNESKNFINETKKWGLQNSFGLWNCIEANDLDNDGDLDYVLGNLGLNSRLKATAIQPLKLYVGDLDSNGGSDQILVYYNEGKPYPFITRDQLIKQIPAFKRRFLHYDDFKNANLDDIVTPVQQNNVALLQANVLSSSLLLQREDSLQLKPLPLEAQISLVYTCLIRDINHDQHPDLILGGNQTEVQPEIGPHDAGFGYVLLNDGKANFSAIPPAKSGFFAPGNIRAIEVVNTKTGQTLLVGRNNNSILTFAVNP